MENLQPDQIYHFKVIRIKENAQEVPAKKIESPDGLLHCHYIDVAHANGMVYNLQVCNVNNFYTDCEVGDRIEVVIKTLTKGRYTLYSLQALEPALDPDPTKIESDAVIKSLESLKKTIPPIATSIPPNPNSATPLKKTSNPPMAGTAAAIALQAAVQYCTGTEIGEEFKKEYPDIEETFEKFFRLLTSKI